MGLCGTIRTLVHVGKPYLVPQCLSPDLQRCRGTSTSQHRADPQVQVRSSGWPPLFPTSTQPSTPTPIHPRQPKMASQTLRPHRSPSPSPSPTPVNPANPAKLTRQSLGPPPAASGTARGFGGLGVASPTFPSGTGGIGAGPHPRHVSSSVALGLSGSRDSMTSSRPSLGTPGNRAVSGAPGPRPSSEFLPSGLTRDTRTPEGQLSRW